MTLGCLHSYLVLPPNFMYNYVNRTLSPHHPRRVDACIPGIVAVGYTCIIPIHWLNGGIIRILTLELLHV